MMTILFSFVYFQYELNKITREKALESEELVANKERSAVE
jgi:hypothetical protein